MNDRVRITNRLRNALKQYYPQVLDWFDHIDTPLFCAFIRQWPSLAQAKRARRATVEKFFHQHNMYRKQLLARRIESIKSAKPLTTDDAVITPYRLQALTLVDQLEVALNALRMYDKEIVTLAPQHPDYALFSTLPGAGPSLAPRLANNENDLPMPLKSKNTRESPRSPNAAARRPGSIGDGNAPPSCGRHSSSGQLKQSTNLTGHGCITISKEPKVAPTRLPFGLSPSSGSEYSTVVGRHGPHTTSLNILMRLRTVGRPCLISSLPLVRLDETTQGDDRT